MSELTRGLSLDELRDRIRAAGVAIPEARHAMVRALLGEALASVQAMDERISKTLEPAVTFAADGPRQGEGHGG
jgi:hypothetical protein